MRVAVLVSQFPSLAETFVLTQLVGLLGLGHEVHMVAKERGPRVEHPEIASHGLMDRVIYQPARGPGLVGSVLFGEWRAAARSGPGVCANAVNPLLHGGRAMSGRRLAEALPWLEMRRLHGPPDVVLCHHGDNGLHAVRVRKTGAFDAPVVTVFHGSDANRAKPGKFDELFRHGELMLPVSGFIAERLRVLGCPDDRSLVHHMGLRFDAFGDHGARANAGRRIELVSVGRLVEVKGLTHAIEAVSMLEPGLRARVRYTIVGGGPLAGELRARAVSLGLGGTVVFTGALPADRVAARLAESDVFLFPSVPVASGENEALGVAMAEAMAQGLPVVASRTGGIPELALDGETAVLVPPGDAGAMARAIGALAGDSDRCRQLGAAGAKRVRALHDAEALNARLALILERVAHGERDFGHDGGDHG